MRYFLQTAAVCFPRRTPGSHAARACRGSRATSSDYPWPRSAPASDVLASRIAPPPGFERIGAEPGSFAAWLRGLPLQPPGAPVLLYNGAPKFRQDVHAAVIDIDVGTRDLQQCADAVMRLRAEWLYAMQRPGEIAFNDTGSGQPIAFSRWAAGERPRISGRSLVWSRSAAPDAGYASFRRYMDTVFTWAGTHSLERELNAATARRHRRRRPLHQGRLPGPRGAGRRHRRNPAPARSASCCCRASCRRRTSTC